MVHRCDLCLPARMVLGLALANPFVDFFANDHRSIFAPGQYSNGDDTSNLRFRRVSLKSQPLAELHLGS